MNAGDGGARSERGAAMPSGFDHVAALAATPVTVERSWDVDTVLRYHLAIGAGADPLDPRELRYAVEDDLVVLPTFGVVLGSDAAALVSNGPGFALDASQYLHGAQSLVVHAPIPAVGAVQSVAWVESVHDTGRAAIVTVRSDTALVTPGEEASPVPLCTNRFTLVLRGEGGFGGAPPPPAEETGGGAEGVASRPERSLDVSTVAQQALWYRLVGDRNPLHHDPAVAARAGFERPPLQGLCTWAMTAKALVDHDLGGDVGRVGAFSARFAGPVHPGDTLRVRWRADGDVLHAAVDAAERGTPALRQVTLRIRT